MNASDVDEGRETRTGVDEPRGAWVKAAVSYVDPDRRFCAYCGRPLGRRFWQSEGEGGAVVFCDPTHAARPTTYPIR